MPPPVFSPQFQDPTASQRIVSEKAISFPAGHLFPCLGTTSPPAAPLPGSPHCAIQEITANGKSFVSAVCSLSVRCPAEGRSRTRAHFLSVNTANEFCNPASGNLVKEYKDGKRTNQNGFVSLHGKIGVCCHLRCPDNSTLSKGHSKVFPCYINTTFTNKNDSSTES